VCYSRDLDSWFKDTHADAPTHYGKTLKHDFLPQYYFGSADGAYRFYPARHSPVCGSYDPRRRPWYVAASSGPKNVILVLDQSGSMTTAGRMEIAKTAAISVIDALTIADYFTVITFGTEAGVVGAETTYMMRATSANKQAMKSAIDNIEPMGRTNFYAGFETAFDILDRSVSQGGSD